MPLLSCERGYIWKMKKLIRNMNRNVPDAITPAGNALSQGSGFVT